MEDISTVDGFMEIAEIMAEMLKYLANEPSVGLFYVQQHTHSTVPNLVTLRNNVDAKSREMALHTEDLGDSIDTLSSMKECGYPIVDEMIEDIKNSLNIMSTKKPKRGLINNSSSLFQMGTNSSWGPSGWGRNEVPLEQEAESISSSSYFSTVFKSAKDRASSLKWVQSDSVGSAHTEGGNLPSILDPSLQAAVPSTSLAMPEVPMPSSKIFNDGLRKESQTNEDLSTNQLCLSESFDEFKAEREARLEKWLQQMNDENHCREALR